MWTPCNARSSDGGSTFDQLKMPAPGFVQALTEDAHGSLYLGLVHIGPNGTDGGLFVSGNAGTTWTRLGAGTILDRGVFSVIALPSGNLLAGPYATQGGGLKCSSDGGRTWAPRCP